MLARVTADRPDVKIGEAVWLDSNDRVVAEARGIECRRGRTSVDRMIHRVEWLPQDDPALVAPHEPLEVLARAFARAALAAVPTPARPEIAALLRPHAAAADAATTPSAAVEALVAAYPDHESEINLVGRCGMALADVLIGTRDPLDLLFSTDRRSPRRLSRLTTGAAPQPGSSGHCRRRKTASCDRDRRRHRRDDTGVARSPARQHRLPLHRHIAGVSDSRATCARRLAGLAHRDVSTSHSIRPAGIEPGTFDVVVAANVLHATPDLPPPSATPPACWRLADGWCWWKAPARWRGSTSRSA